VRGPTHAPRQNRVVDQRIATTRLTDGSRIAYAVAGRGPVLVHAPGWLTHLELSWAMPPERALYESLAQGRTVVRYDKAGCGLSGAAGRIPSMELELETLDAVIRAVGASRFDLYGASLGAAVAAAWTAEHPARVARLVLYGGWVRGADIAAMPVREHVLGLVAEHWGLGSDVLADIFAPDSDAATRTAFVRYQREAATPQTARAMLALTYDIDITDVLTNVQAPTLVLHRDHDRAAPLEQGRALAAGIPGARLEVLPGRNHLPYIGDSDAIAQAIRSFLGLSPLRSVPGASVTRRQYEVAQLVAQGLTNRDIAGRLGISERSAESHVERIRDRLGFRSRSQIAAWIVAGGR
jgi:pimeloyl-ACP methyl ester carboxylesterase/DNA-binding CsgD family transcriptional regulator